MQFKNLPIIPPIMKAVEKAGYTTATEIQSKTIPHTLKGGDIIGCAQTGTGKTASFAIPVLQLLHDKKVKHSKVRALVLTPTRELAIQVSDNFKSYGAYLSVSHLAIFGGVSHEPQKAALKKGVDILIATPGRLMDLYEQGYIDFSQIEILVLDEADRMLDMGFVHEVKRIVAKLPTKRQTLFFSATMPEAIRKLAKQLLKDPIEINVTPVSSTANSVKQSVYFVEKNEKLKLLVELLSDKEINRSLVFSRTKHGADRLAKQLLKTGITAAAIHGNKSQNNRQRALNDFKGSKIRVLIATDIAARGIDIDELPHVVNYELPNVAETYVHRIGRTGRAGKQGVAVSFCDRDEKKDLKNIQNLIGFTMTVAKNTALPTRNV
ncbi:DEAD/DEAH box helicase [Imtechella halotolerans]|uniref:DEAD-box ATP-dependent RNA helicase RhpA n=1 Tax=Imtechella halotolerans K1 TaxID=946077 RepID=I0W5M9_9FLAO|nr:DEAD/DEAH box helicase [Imtechella halotolerans]EID71695.1 dead/deah box helicase domain protein [Imtechella halotolerans K1]WMQ64030.1 DEAD/DEAH box helicase [Imtechella halotolerans]